MMAASMASKAEPPRRRMDQPAVRASWQPDVASVYGFVRNVPSAAMNNESRFHRNQDGKGMSVCLGEAERWPEEKELNTEITEFAEFTEKKNPSNKEIENKKKETDEEKNGAGIDAAAREAAQGADKGSGDGFEAGILRGLQ